MSLPDLPTRFETADAAIAQLVSEGFTKDSYDPTYPWRSRCGLVTARVISRPSPGYRHGYVIDAIA